MACIIKVKTKGLKRFGGVGIGMLSIKNGKPFVSAGGDIFELHEAIKVLKQLNAMPRFDAKNELIDAQIIGF